MIRTFRLSLAAAAALTASPAFAQDEEDDRPLIVSFGVGPQVVPKYQGSDEYGISPLLGGHVRREGDPIPTSAPDDGFGFKLTGRGPVEFGPMVQLQGKREQEDVGAPIGDVDFAVEPGAFVNFNLSDNFRLRAEARRGFGGHEGWVGDIGADIFARPDADTMFSIGPRVRLADDEYMETYYGFNLGPIPAVVGFPVYRPDGGVRAVGLVTGITRQITRSFGVYAYAGYDRLVGDAADSPIVTQFGSRDQFSGGIALYFSFRMRDPF